MNKLFAVLQRNSQIISILLFTVSFCLFFIPFTAPLYQRPLPLENSAYEIMRSLVCYPEFTSLSMFAIMFVYTALWLSLIFSIFFSTRYPFIFLWSGLPFSVVFFGTIYMVTLFGNPNAAVFIMAVVYAFYLLSLCTAIWYAVKHGLFHNLKLRIHPPREHKPTKSERIAELERQVAELTKEKDAE